MAPSAPVRVTGPASIRTPQAWNWPTISSGATATMKQRSWLPGMQTSAASQSSCGTSAGRRLIFWLPNFSAMRGRGAEILPLHPEDALVPGGHDLHVPAVDDEVVQPIDREAHQGSAFRKPGRDLDLDAHGIGLQPGMDQGGGGAGLAEVALHHRPAGLPIAAIRHDEQHPHHVIEAGAGLGQGGGDILEALRRLGHHVIGDGHRLVVVAGGAGDPDMVAIHHGAAVADLLLEAAAGGDEPTLHHSSPS